MATKKQTTTASKPDLSVFSLEVSPKLIAQALYVYQENTHVGVSKTKSRGEVDLTKKKVYRQKGTGGARHGSKSAPIYVGGGVTFGPHGIAKAPKMLNQKVKLLSLAGVLSIYRQDQKIELIDSASFTKQNTKELNQKLGSSPLGLVMHEENENFIKSIGNLKQVTLYSASRLNAYKVALVPRLVITQKALEVLVQRLQPITSKNNSK